jgi:hypothetical protein
MLQNIINGTGGYQLHFAIPPNRVPGPRAATANSEIDLKKIRPRPIFLFIARERPNRTGSPFSQEEL